MDPSDLNPAQARVQKIKDELRTLDIDHLHSFLEGITDPEPPNYQKVTGVVKPPPAKVTLKESATTYKVGNVEFEDEIHAISLVVKDGVVEVKFDDALPRDSGNSLCFPIHDAVLLDLIPLWEVKYKAIKHRMAQINDVRAYAYNCPNQPEPRLKYGKVRKMNMFLSPVSLC